MEEAREDRDRADVRRVLAGDVAAFEGIVRRWQGPLVNLAYRYCRHEGRAEEMAQEAFLRAFRFLDRFRDEASFSTWLFAVAINVYRSQMRRIPPPEVPLEEARGREPSGPGAGPEDRAVGSERAEAVRRMVCRLPGKYRDAVILFYFCELDVAQAAGCLQMAKGTFKSRLHRARKLLESRFAGAGLAPRAKEAT